MALDDFLNRTLFKSCLWNTWIPILVIFLASKCDSCRARIPVLHCTFSLLGLCSQLSYSSKSAKYSLTLLIILNIAVVWFPLGNAMYCFGVFLIPDLLQKSFLRPYPSAPFSNVPKLKHAFWWNNDFGF